VKKKRIKVRSANTIIQDRIVHALERGVPHRQFNVRVRNNGLGTITIKDVTRDIIVNYSIDGQKVKGELNLSQGVRPGQLVSLIVTNCQMYGGRFYFKRHTGWKRIVTDVLMVVLKRLHPQPNTSAIAFAKPTK
jgi:hypothetical protein